MSSVLKVSIYYKKDFVTEILDDATDMIEQ